MASSENFLHGFFPPSVMVYVGSHFRGRRALYGLWRGCPGLGGSSSISLVKVTVFQEWEDRYFISESNDILGVERPVFHQ